ncbi:MAG: DUF302 domain-containing protein [Gammaproteobacteria bacterium]|nr:DUF302 domain-containing protein [Gammaproteobacteria bacterium]
MLKLLTSLAAVVVLTACTPPPPPPAPVLGLSKVYSKEARFDDARDDLKAAIENRGLVIDHTSHIHDMLERTGKDLGTVTPVFVNAESYLFCSAVVSRQTMEADPHNIVFCPYVIAVYTIVQEPTKVYIAYRRPQQPTGTPQSQASLKAVEELLDDIAREALNIKTGDTPAKPAT